MATIIHFVLTLDIGGLERLVVDLAREQKQRGHDVRIYCLFHSGPAAAPAAEAGIPIVEFHAQELSPPVKLISVCRALRLAKPDVVHSHNPGVHPYAAVAARLVRTPVVINTRHGIAAHFGTPYQESRFKLVYRLTDRVVFVSTDTRDFYVNELGLYGSKSAVVVNGIRTSAFRSRPASPGRRKPRIVFGTVGRLAPVKAHDVLLRAFQIVSRTLPDAELRITGGGETAPSIVTLIDQLGLQQRVRLDGPTSDVPRVLSGLDVFVISSNSEGLPLAVLEAMAAGLPIVSTRVGGIPEVAPEGSVAWYCPPGNPEQLAQAMLKAAASPNLHSMGVTASEIASSRFDLSAMASQYERLYEDALEKRRS